MPTPEHERLLRGNARGFAEVILTNIRREYPNYPGHTTTGPDDRPRPHEIHPAFYGCFDWHSCVEMHWALVRLLRVLPGEVPDEGARAALDEHLTPDRIAVEAAYFRTHRSFRRPYGWGWALMLAHETASWGADGDVGAARWATALAPLGEILTERFLDWLPRATYPERDGMHNNSAFGLSRALPYARARARDGDPALLDAITAAAHRWFGADRDYPGAWEPSGSDFLSPALTEAALMADLADGQPERFVRWLDGFLPGLAGGEPASLFTPATVSDPTDGMIAHLHGLNLSRAYCWARVADLLPAGDPRVAPIRAAVDRHADAALPQVTGSDYMVEHWLACYAVLLLT